MKMVTVPLEPTEQMIEAAVAAGYASSHARRIYAAMVGGPSARDDAKKSRPPSDEEPWVVADDTGLRVTFRAEDAAWRYRDEYTDRLVNPTVTREPATENAGAAAMATPADIRRLEDEAYEMGKDCIRREIAEILPGAYYMDLPDGGSTPIMEQLERMAADAARYRWLVEKTGDVLPMARVQVMRRGQYTLHVGRDLDEAIAYAVVTK